MTQNASHRFTCGSRSRDVSWSSPATTCKPFFPGEVQGARVDRRLSSFEQPRQVLATSTSSFGKQRQSRVIRICRAFPYSGRKRNVTSTKQQANTCVTTQRSGLACEAVNQKSLGVQPIFQSLKYVPKLLVPDTADIQFSCVKTTNKVCQKTGNQDLIRTANSDSKCHENSYKPVSWYGKVGDAMKVHVFDDDDLFDLNDVGDEMDFDHKPSETPSTKRSSENVEKTYSHETADFTKALNEAYEHFCEGFASAGILVEDEDLALSELLPVLGKAFNDLSDTFKDGAVTNILDSLAEAYASLSDAFASAGIYIEDLVTSNPLSKRLRLNVLKEAWQLLSDAFASSSMLLEVETAAKDQQKLEDITIAINKTADIAFNLYDIVSPRGRKRKRGFGVVEDVPRKRQRLSLISHLNVF